MTTWELHITGRVQGVGFRPHVYRLARTLGLRGVVRNGNDGVRVVFNAHEVLAAEFRNRLLSSPPPLAVITEHSLTAVAGQRFDGFKIGESKARAKPDLLISPDFAICPDCRHEVDRYTDRRFGYAFTTCTNCGPRYSISTALPYDRERTTMTAFGMCPTCAAEYNDPENRRHFSQTNSCPDCGITLSLTNKEGARARVQGMLEIARRLKAGNIVAVKGVAGYLLLADANNAKTIDRLRFVKERRDKPLAILYPNADAVVGTYFPGARVMAELTSTAAPIVLVKTTDKVRARLATEKLAPFLNRLGVMLPNSPLLHLIAKEFDGPLVATSANVAGEPILSEGQEEVVAGLADYVVQHNLPIAQAQDDSLVAFTEVAKQRIVLRRGRGLAPALNPPAAQPPGADLLACGADLKGGIGLRANNRFYLSPFLGDLGGYSTQRRFRATLDHLSGITNAEPVRVLTDLHPGYFSTGLGEQITEEKNLEISPIQHHEAHFAAILGEHDLLDAPEAVLGVIWDGTGLGTDGNIWGGEFFRFEDRRIKRVGHLPYFPNVGGDKMAYEPRYAALAWAGDVGRVRDRLEASFGTLPLNNLLHLRPRQKLLTSSVGRLFDAVTFLLGLAETQSYEGMAAVQLEQLARTALRKNPALAPYTFAYLREELIADLGVRPTAEIAARFHCTLVDWVRQTAANQKTTRLTFSGGVFQNTLLVDLLIERLHGHQLYFHQQLPPNDENIAYGQLIHHALHHEAAHETSKLSNYVLSDSR